MLHLRRIKNPYTSLRPVVNEIGFHYHHVVPQNASDDLGQFLDSIAFCLDAAPDGHEYQDHAPQSAAFRESAELKGGCQFRSRPEWHGSIQPSMVDVALGNVDDDLTLRSVDMPP